MREPYFPAASIHLTQSVCFTDGYHEDSFLKGAVPYLSEADRAFQAVRFFDVELAHFYSYHLDRFGYSAAASPAN